MMMTRPNGSDEALGLRGHIVSAVRRVHAKRTTRRILQVIVVNGLSTATFAIASIIIARALGPAGRGDYAAVQVWYFVFLVIGEIGITSAVCYFVSRFPAYAARYVATARTLVLCTGSIFICAGIAIAPILAHGRADLTTAYRIVFACCAFGYLAGPYSSGLQASNILHWNCARAVHPIFYLGAIVCLNLTGQLTLLTTVISFGLSAFVELLASYWLCSKNGLTRGRTTKGMAGPLVGYGLKQVGSMAPTLTNSRLDQLVLSQYVPSSELGNYAVAVTLTSLAMPAVNAIGNVAFPRIAAGFADPSRMKKLQQAAVLGSVVLAGVIILPICIAAPYIVPVVFGPGYEGAVTLVWALAAGGVFLACGQVAGDLLRGRNRPLLVARAQLYAALLTVVGLAVLLPVAGVFGAAITSSVAYGSSFALMLRSLCRLERN
jgi:O-antigen/teichoic acid export membrane protein